MSLNLTLVSTFDNIFETTTPTHRPILEVLSEMRNPGPILKKNLEMIRKAATPGEQAKLKVQLLPVICPSGTFSSRTDTALIDYSGIICLDLDDTLDIPGMKALSKTFPYTLAAMVSPTGTGVKVFVLTDLQDPARHSDLYHHLGSIMGFKSRIDLKFDPSCSNPSRACFFSVDPKMYINADAEPYHVDLATLPIYTPPAKTSTVVPRIKTDIVLDDIDFPAPLKDAGQIRNAIKESHSLFEATHPMFQGVRNVNLFTLAFFFRLDGIPEDVATDYLVAYYSDPAGDFSAAEIKRTVQSAYNR